MNFSNLIPKIQEFATSLEPILNSYNQNESKIKALKENPICCGKIETRNYMGKLSFYANHSVNARCTYPGHEEDSTTSRRGVRKYIRKSDLEKVKQAQENYEKVTQLQREKNHLIVFLQQVQLYLFTLEKRRNSIHDL